MSESMPIALQAMLGISFAIDQVCKDDKEVQALLMIASEEVGGNYFRKKVNSGRVLSHKSESLPFVYG